MSLTINHFYRFGEFILDADQKILLRDGKPLPLTPKVFDTLLILVEQSGRIVGKEELMRRLWPETFVEEANLTFNIQQLRKTLGDSARKPRYVETVARRGYRFIAEVEEVLSDSAPAGNQIIRKFETAAAQAATEGDGDSSTVVEREAAGSAPIEPARREDEAVERVATAGRATTPAATWSKRKTLAVAALAAAVVAGLLFAWYRFSSRPQTAGGRVMLAVLPFENLTGDASQEYFSDGLTEEMITQLGGLDPRRLGVIARTSVMHYKDTHEPLDQIGRELGVQYILEGSVRRDSDDVRVTAQLIRVRDQTPVWSRQYDRQLRGLLVLQREIGQEVADQIQLTLGANKPTEAASGPPLSPQGYEAYDLYLKGQYFWNKRTVEGFQQAIDYFQRAADTDPTYARAYVGLADSYALIGGYSGHPQAEFMQKARSAALRALELDERSAEAHTALALVVQNYDWDWQTAEREFRRAIELNPNYATAHHWYAEHLMWRGRFDEALQESERARQLDPLSLIIAADRGAILYYARQYDEAIAQFRAVRELDPAFPRAGIIVAAYEQKGMFAEALADIEGGRTMYDSSNSPWYWSALAKAYGRTGQRERAERALEKLKELNRRQEVDADVFIGAYTGMGDKDQTLAWLEKAYSQHSNVITTLKVEPDFDPLRGDPRFQDLLRRAGLDR
jgi:TolB-like protein/DNA-binding winged helix-turn-helix (wHTH) protein/Tfp pilus assembly protein PilF